MNVIKLFNALNEGEFAYRVGVALEDCPYDMDSSFGEWWAFGWVSEEESKKLLDIYAK